MALNLGELEAVLRLKDEFSSQIKSASSNASSFEKTLGTIGKTLTAAFTIKEIKSFIFSSIELGSHIDDLSKSTNIGTDELQKLAFAGKRVGMEIDELTGLVGMLSKKLSLGDDGAAGAVAALGLNLSELKQKKPDELFSTLVTEVGKIRDPLLQARLGSELFGRQYQSALRLANDGLLATMNSQESLNAVISKDGIAALDKLGDQWTDLITILKVQGAQAFLEVVAFLKFIASNVGTIKIFAAAIGVAGVAYGAMSLAAFAASYGVTAFTAATYLATTAVNAFLASTGVGKLVVGAITVALGLAYGAWKLFGGGAEEASQAASNASRDAEEATKVLSDNSREHFEKIAITAKKTYEDMAADPKRFSEATIAEYKKIAEAAAEALKPPLTQSQALSNELDYLRKQALIPLNAENKKLAIGFLNVGVGAAEVATKLGVSETIVTKLSDSLKESAKRTKEKAEAIKILDGYSKDYQQTLKTVDAGVKIEIENYLKAGANINDIAKKYSQLTQAQVESVQKSVEAENQRVEALSKANDEIRKLQQDAADAINSLDADTLENRLKHLTIQREREYAAVRDSIFTTEERAKAKLAIEQRYNALETAEQRKAANEKNKIVAEGAMLYVSIVKTAADVAFNLTATDREKSLRAIKQNEIDKLKEILDKTIEGTDIRKSAQDAVRQSSKEAVAALLIDNAALTANSKKQFQETADIAKATYAEMAKAPTGTFLPATILAFKKAAEAAQNTASGIQHYWKEAFTNIASGITNILINAFTKGGGIVAAAKGVAVLAGSEIGKAVDKMTEKFGKLAGPLGAALGSLAGPLTEGMISLFTRASRAREELIKIGKEADTLHRKFVEMNKSIGDVDARARELGFSMNWAAKSKADIEALNNQMEAFARLLEQMKEASEKITIGFAAVTEELTSGFDEIGNAVKDAQAELKEAEKSYKQLSESGEASSEDLVKAEQRIADAIMAVVGAQVNQAAAATKTEQILKDLGTQGVATFASVMIATGSYSEALKAVGPTLGKLQKAYTDLGLNVEDVALKHLMVQSTVAAANPSLMAAIDGQKGAMQGMAQMGLLNVETFAAMQRTGMELFNRLNAKVIEAGGDIRDALMPMQGYLQQAALQAKLLGLPLDANTQKLIDQSQKLGIWKEAGQTANDLLIAGMTELVAKVGQLLDKLFQTKNVLSALPSPTINIHTIYTHSGKPPNQTSQIESQTGDQTGFAQGGIVPGYAAGIDSVPAMLTPGESVLTVAATQRVGSSAINDLNNGRIPGVGNAEAIVDELKAIRLQQDAQSRKLPFLVAVAVRDALALSR